MAGVTQRPMCGTCYRPAVGTVYRTPPWRKIAGLGPLMVPSCATCLPRYRRPSRWRR